MAPKLKLFSASQFTPTAYDTAEDKAKFAAHFVRFVRSDFKRSLFPKWFYTRLSMTFGHIAHYDIDGFYSVQCSTTARKLDFLKQTVEFPSFMGGDPAYTYSDVERALALWVKQERVIDLYAGKLAMETELAEREQLARLTFKYQQPDGTLKPLGTVIK